MKLLTLAAIGALLAGCAGPDVQQYRHNTPTLDLPAFFDGTTDAWGMFQKRSGEVVKRFHVEITGVASADTLTLDERFRYDDGSTQRRLWTLNRTDAQHWRGSAADVVGAASGETAGNALRWQYTMLLPVDDSTYEMRFDDWMFLVDRCTMLNHASMRKFGIELGQVTLTFRKRSCAP